jgi:hypothetical protein
MKPVAAIAAPIKIGFLHAALADVALTAEIPVAASAAAVYQRMDTSFMKCSQTVLNRSIEVFMKNKFNYCYKLLEILIDFLSYQS